MSLEADLYSTLMEICPRVYPDIAPEPIPAKPFVVYQQVGGQVIDTLNDPSDLLNARIQVAVWDVSRVSANQLMREIESSMRQSTRFQAKPMGALVTDLDDDVKLYGARQDFTVFHR